MLSKLFQKEGEAPRADRDFQTLFKIVKELDKQGLNKLIKGIEALWEGYNALRTLKTRDEKEVRPVDEVEKKLEDSFEEVEP